MAGQTNYRLGWGAIVIIVFTAVIADLVTLIPFTGDFMGPTYWVCLNVFLFTKGFGIVNARRLTTSIISTVTEMIPVVQEFPLITAGVIVFVIFTRLEDRTGLSLTKGKAGLVSSAKQPLNQGDRREPQPGNQMAEPAGPAPEEAVGRNQNTQPLNIDGMRKAA